MPCASGPPSAWLRGRGGPDLPPYFSDFIKSIGLTKDRAMEVQRIGSIPDNILTKRFREREWWGLEAISKPRGFISDW